MRGSGGVEGRSLASTGWATAFQRPAIFLRASRICRELLYLCYTDPPLLEHPLTCCLLLVPAGCSLFSHLLWPGSSSCGQERRLVLVGVPRTCPEDMACACLVNQRLHDEVLNSVLMVGPWLVFGPQIAFAETGPMIPKLAVEEPGGRPPPQPRDCSCLFNIVYFLKIILDIPPPPENLSYIIWVWVF